MAELILQGMKYQVVEGLEIKSHSKGSSEPIIIDAIATKEGVWKGVYRSGQLIKDNVKWLKGRYITLNHPPMSRGGRASADLAVGQIQDAWYIPEGNKAGVRCELWPQKIPGEILQKIDDHQIVDVSTGFYAAEEPTKGVWQGHDYNAVEKSLDFDHLALVPIGACSQDDGCGLGLHSEDLSKIDLKTCSIEQLHEHLGNALGWTCALHHSSEKGSVLDQTKVFLDRVVGETLQKDEPGLKSSIFDLTPCKRDILLHSFDRVSETIKGHLLETNEANTYKEETNSDEKESINMADEKNKGAGAGDLSFGKADDLTGFITNVKGMKPEEQAVQALKGLETMAGLWTSQKGPFTPAQAPAPATYPVPAVTVTPGEQGAAEKLEITWQEGKTPEEAKQAISTAITGFHSKAIALDKTVGELNGKITGLNKEIQTIKAHSAAEQMARIKQHSGLSDEEMKVYEGMSSEALSTIADHFQKIKQHSGDGGQTPLDPPAGGKKGGKRTKEELEALNDQMDAQLGIKANGKKK